MMYRWLAAVIVIVSTLEFPCIPTSYGRFASEIKELPGWRKVVDEAADCEFKDAKDKLRIVVPGRYHDFDPRPGVKNNGPRGVQEIEADVTADVKVRVTIGSNGGTG